MILRFFSCLPLLLLILSSFSGCSADLEWHQEDGYKWAELSPGYFGEDGFSKIPSSSTNITFTNHAPQESIIENRNFLNGSGVTAADIDSDGKVDIYFAQLSGANKLYKNMGDLRFKDITAEAGVAHEGYNSTGTVFADVDGDGDQDLLISSLNKDNALYLNDGNGSFVLKEDSGLGKAKGSNTMALADIDSDGDLDLYISNFKTKTARDIYTEEELSIANTVKRQGDSLTVVPPFDKYFGIIATDGRSYRNEYGDQDQFYLNDGDGTFQRVNDEEYFFDSEGTPVGLARDWGLAAKFQDINNDMLPDLYVANDFWTPDRLWINQGNGTFRRSKKNTLRNLSLSAMGVDFADINKDGFVDIFVTEMLSADHQRNKRQLTDFLDPINGRPQYNRNSLYLNRGDHTFAEIAYYSGVEASEWSWVSKFLDVDLDGYDDLIISTGNQYDYLDMDTQYSANKQVSRSSRKVGNIVSYPKLEAPNKIFQNNGDLTFTDKSSEWGFLEEDITMGLISTDLDNDGDPDLVMNRLNQEATVYQNNSVSARIAVQLRGNSLNTKGIGAKVVLKGASVIQKKEMTAGGAYVSGDENILYFAADEDNKNHELTVQWSNGKQTTIHDVQANRIYVIEEHAAGENITADKKNSSPTMFKDISDALGHTHTEDPYNDYNIQALLPHKISHQGPGISWIDFNQDGLDDLFIPAGKGENLSIFKNVGNAHFELVTPEGMPSKSAGDQTTILGWREEKSTNLVIGSANFEQGNPNVPSAFHYVIDEAGTVVEKEPVPGTLSTTGPLAASDYDGDGDVDLFVGGSFKPGKYPQDATSRLFQNENGQFAEDYSSKQILDNLGLVSGAVFSDFDRDGDQDLLISRTWDSLVLLENDGEHFRNVSNEVGLDGLKGWWRGVSTGDFNNDGLPDIVATNIGTNSIYQANDDSPDRLYYGDFDMNGTLDIIDSYYSSEVGGYVPRRELYEFDSMPSVLSSVGSHTKFAQSTVDEIFHQNFSTVPFKEINTRKHMVFINNGEQFVAHPLPEYSQISAAFSPLVADYNNDGNEDLLLSQNFFQFPENIPRLDAGRGLLMLGEGTGEFIIKKGQESGIKSYGEQRGAAVSDINQDNRIDIAITQNQGETLLFLNKADKPGYRISLIGPPGNESAIGSTLQMVYEDSTRGPLREIQAGSSYWSQLSSTNILGTSSDASAIEVTWPTGSVEKIPLQEDKFKYTLHF